MNHFSCISILLLLLSCNNDPSKKESVSNAKRVEIHLSDSLGDISFNVPVRYDTAFSWIHYSDCNTCHIQKYRFQSKRDPVLKESGFYWNIPKDSVDRFTISYTKNLFYIGNDTARNLGFLNNLKNQLKWERQGMNIIWDTCYKINDRYFSIVELENKDSIHRKELATCTTIRGNIVYLDCELMSGINDSISRNFFNSSLDLINSVAIKNGNQKF